MIKGIGVDLVDISRMEKMITNEKFVQRVLTSEEQVIFYSLGSKRQVEFLAGRFACKEAYSKALGTGIGQRVSFQDLSILSQSSGAPYFAQHPYHEYTVHVSIAHTDLVATAYVILEQ